jgi:plastocyanin
LSKLISSGLLNPVGGGATSFSLQIGNLSGRVPYECLLHDASGMKAALKIAP